MVKLEELGEGVDNQREGVTSSWRVPSSGREGHSSGVNSNATGSLNGDVTCGVNSEASGGKNDDATGGVKSDATGGVPAKPGKVGLVLDTDDVSMRREEATRKEAMETSEESRFHDAVDVAFSSSGSEFLEIAVPAPPPPAPAPPLAAALHVPPLNAEGTARDPKSAGERPHPADSDSSSSELDPPHGADPSACDTERGEGKEAETGRSQAAEEDTFQDSMTQEDLKQSAISDADALKSKGNALYKGGEYTAAVAQYSAALEVCPALAETAELRAACHANTAACFLSAEEYTDCVKACSAALELKPEYVKVLLRRAQAYEQLDKLEEALTDYQKVCCLDQNHTVAQSSCKRLQPIVEERREKLKEEMLGKLKDLGNSVLGHFGLSMDNFKAVKDPQTGSYSISFQN